MSVLDTLESKIGRYAIPGLIRYVVVLNALVFILLTLDPNYVTALVLDRDLILQGQIWRLVTWVFIPTTLSFIWILLALYYEWFLGDLLEGTWGTFKLNAYVLIGYLAITASALIFGQSFANAALIASLLFAVGTVLPEFTILILFVLPVKIKWIALISAALYALAALGGDWATRATIVLTFANYFLFFGPAFFRQIRDSQKTAARRAKFEAAKDRSDTLHRCETCHRTEVTAPDLDFRVTASGHEYCTDHLPK